MSCCKCIEYRMYTTARTKCPRRRRRRERRKNTTCPPGWNCGQSAKGSSVLTWKCPPGWICGPGYAYNVAYYKGAHKINNTNV